MAETAYRLKNFTESVIREMTRVAEQHGAINLAQGFPDFDPPAELLEAAKQALQNGYNQYAVTWGSPRSARRWPGSKLTSWGGRSTPTSTSR
jgi:aminotransferase